MSALARLHGFTYAVGFGKMADWLFPVAPNEGLRFVNIGKFRLGFKNIGPKQGEKKKLAITMGKHYGCIFCIV